MSGDAQFLPSTVAHPNPRKLRHVLENGVTGLKKNRRGQMGVTVTGRSREARNTRGNRLGVCEFFGPNQDRPKKEQIENKNKIPTPRNAVKIAKLELSCACLSRCLMFVVVVFCFCKVNCHHFRENTKVEWGRWAKFQLCEYEACKSHWRESVQNWRGTGLQAMKVCWHELASEMGDCKIMLENYVGKLDISWQLPSTRAKSKRRVLRGSSTFIVPHAKEHDTRMTLVVNVASICWEPICGWCKSVSGLGSWASSGDRVVRCNWVTQAKPYRIYRFHATNQIVEANFVCTCSIQFKRWFVLLFFVRLWGMIAWDKHERLKIMDSEWILWTAIG